MDKKELELRMYFFTIYQLTGIQAGIQCGHASLEYAFKYGDTLTFRDFIMNWKTWIILNGGTTNSGRGLDGIVKGSLDQIGDDLLSNNIQFTYFQEPDLNDALTAVCFICDERVWNYEDYPDFINYVINNHEWTISSVDCVKLRMMPYDELKELYSDDYEKWTNSLGGRKNVFLRELIKGKKLA